MSMRVNVHCPALAWATKRNTVGCIGGICFLSLVIFPAPAANVTVNVTSNLSIVAPTAFGIHTSVYDNQNGNAALPGRLVASGVNTLRYPGGGYADVYHWSRSSPTTPFFGGSPG